jgi:long-subunit acyl-CoA synthetase (AMP-forming)
MCEAFQLTAARRADEVALRTLGGAVEITFAQYAERVRRLAGALHTLGVRRGDTVGFMLTNRIEFHLLDCAAMHLGATPFSIYNTSSAEQIAYLLGDAGNRVLIVEQALAERPRAALASGGTVEHLIVIDAEAAGGSELTLAELEALEPGPDFDFEASWRAVQGDDVLTLIYTSGTTGPPKGVQLTHRNQLEESRGLQGAMPWRDEGGAVVSFLPSAHIADRGMLHLGQMIWGFQITPCPDPARVFEYVADVRPTWFGSVPRMWEKLKASLEASGAALADPAAIRAKLGFDRCELYMIGAAPAPLELFQFFDRLGIPICEVWGMSELSCVATLVPPEAPRYGTVGRPLPGVELRLAEDGEVLVRGGIVMGGYRNQPEKTAETIDADGWLHTGDIGTLDEDGILRIIDRKKELIINAAGKNMSPANIEQQLKMGSPLIGQAVAIGDRRPYNVALIVLDPDACAAFAAARGRPDADVAAMARDDAVLGEVAAGVERANQALSRVEQIKRFTILPLDWQPAGDELTPTMKLKRRPIAEKYALEIEALYTG